MSSNPSLSAILSSNSDLSEILERRSDAPNPPKLRLVQPNIQNSEEALDWQANIPRLCPLFHCIFVRYRSHLGMAVLWRRSERDGQDRGPVVSLVAARLEGEAASRRPGVHDGGCKFSSGGAA
jgi:hypothetical protein